MLDPRAIFKRLDSTWGAPVEFGSDGYVLSNGDYDRRIIVSDMAQVAQGWTHASIYRRSGIPSYEDLAMLHRVVWPGGWAYQCFAPPEAHVNIHPYVLHLWGLSDGAPALPNFGMFGTIQVDPSLVAERYVKRPVEVEAMCWPGGAEAAGPVIDWVLSTGFRSARYHGAWPGGGGGWPDEPEYLEIDTPEGRMRANPGDWIIRGTQGEHYPCKPDVFEAVYKPASQSVECFSQKVWTGGLMLVLSMNAGADTGGNGWNLAQSFLRHPQPGITFRSSATKQNYLQYPIDLAWGEALKLWPKARVAHFRNNSMTARHLPGALKPYVIHHHGTFYRDHHEALNREVANAQVPAAAVCATLDLLDYGDDVTWAPQTHDLDAIAALRVQHPARSRRLRIAHAPTDRSIKSTDEFLRACSVLKVEPVLVENRTWDECLRIKATCDVLYDQVALGYGNNAIEAWAMGLPVIAGAARPTLTRMARTFGGQIPFVAATEGTIGDAIRLLMDEDERARWGQVGRAHAERWHNGKETVTRLAAIYRRLGAVKCPAPVTPPVRARNARQARRAR